MHELSIAQSILEIVGQNLPAENQKHVKSVIVRIGKLSNVLPESLNFCFEAITRETDFENTQLVIKVIPITIECKNCGKISETEDFVFLCPSCSSNKISVIGGNDLNVEEIEVE
jgi:hydrogenase nickel incorporation protein HypA/HybF